LVQRLEPLESGLAAPDGRTSRNPEELRGVEQHVAYGFQVMGVLSGDELAELRLHLVLGSSLNGTSADDQNCRECGA
jgi:hypothetical protein